ncbi:MAG: HD domain-containing protein [Oceanihabitans sp.]
MKQKFQELYLYIVNILETKLPKHLTYHNTKHTLYVLEKAVYIAAKENINKSDLFLLKTAALLHDIGFINTNINHEEESCKIAKAILKKFSFSENEIEQICSMIMATKIPQKPKTILEKILADADLEYLATNAFKTVSNTLYKEFKHFTPTLSIAQWNTIQINFIKNHEFHTKYCKHYKEHRKLKNLQTLL